MPSDADAYARSRGMGPMKKPRTVCCSGLSDTNLIAQRRKRSLLTSSLALETTHAVHLCEQGIVSADADVHAGVDASAALAHQDVAGLDELTISALRDQGAWTRSHGRFLVDQPPFVVGEELKTNTDHDTDHPFFRMMERKSLFL